MGEKGTEGTVPAVAMRDSISKSFFAHVIPGKGLARRQQVHTASPSVAGRDHTAQWCAHTASPMAAGEDRTAQWCAGGLAAGRAGSAPHPWNFWCPLGEGTKVEIRIYIYIFIIYMYIYIFILKNNIYYIIDNISYIKYGI